MPEPTTLADLLGAQDTGGQTPTSTLADLLSATPATGKPAQREQLRREAELAKVAKQEAEQAEAIYSGRRYATMGVPEALQPVLGYTEAGVRDFAVGVGEGAKSLLLDLPNWLSGGKLQSQSEAVGKWLREQSVADKALIGQEPAYVKALTGVGRGIGSSIPSMAVGGGVGTGLAKSTALLTTKKGAQWVAQLVGQTTAESTSEAANTYTDVYQIAKERGLSDDEADKAASEGARNVRNANAVLLSVTNLIGPTGRMVKGLVRDTAVKETAKQLGLPRRAAKFLLNRTADALVEGQVEERFQEGIQQAARKGALKGDFNSFYKDALAEGLTSKEASEAAYVGMLIGGIMGTTADVLGRATQQQETAAPVGTQLDLSALDQPTPEVTPEVAPEVVAEQNTPFREATPVEAAVSELRPWEQRRTLSPEDQALLLEQGQVETPVVVQPENRLDTAIARAETDLLALQAAKPDGKKGANMQAWRDEVALAERRLADLQTAKQQEVANAAQVGQIPEGSVGERQQVGEGGLPTAPSGSDLLGQGGQVEAQTQEVNPVEQGILGQIAADTQTVLDKYRAVEAQAAPIIDAAQRQGATPQAVAAGQQAQVQLEQAAAQRDASLKRLQKQALEADRTGAGKRAAEMFARTREAIKRNASGLQANANGYLDIAVALVQDLAAMGQRGVEAFVNYAKQVLDRQQLAQVERNYGSLEGLYEQAIAAGKREITSNGQKVTLSEPDLIAEATTATNEANYAIEQLRNREMTSAARRDAIASVKADLQLKLDDIASRVGQDVTQREAPTPLPATETEGDIYGQKFVYFSSGLNFMEAIDTALRAAGRPTIGERLGIENWNDVSLKQYVAALTKTIKSLGKTIEETTLKLKQVFRDVPTDVLRKLAEVAHNYRDMSKADRISKPQAVKIAKEVKTKAMPSGIATVNETFNELQNSLTLADKETIEAVKGIGIKTLDWAADKSGNVYKWLRSGTLHPNIRALFNAKFKAGKEILDSYVDAVGRIRASFHDLSAQLDNLYRTSKGDNAQYGKEQNDLLGLVLAVGSMLNEGEGRVFTREELKKLAPQLGPEATELYFKIRKRVDQTTKDLLESLQVTDNNTKARLYELTQKTRAEQRAADAAGDSRAAVKAQTTLVQLEQQLEDWNSAYADAVKNYRNKAYWPLNRYGKYRYDIFDNGKRIGMWLSEKAGAAGKADVMRQIALSTTYAPALKQILAEGREPDIRYVKATTTEDLGGAVEFDGPVMRLLMAGKNIDGALETQMELAVAKVFTDDFAKAHMQNRKGVVGFSTDAQRVLDSFSRVTSNLIANNLYKHQLEDARKSMEADPSNPSSYQEGLDRDEFEKLVRETKNPTYSPIANAITASVYLAGLGFVPAFAVGQAIQYAGMVAPLMANFYHGSKTATPAKAAAFAFLKLAPRIVRPFSVVDGKISVEAADLNKMGPEEIAALVNASVRPQDYLTFTNGNKEAAQRMADNVRESLLHLLNTSAFQSTAKQFASESMFGARGAAGPATRLMEGVSEAGSYFAEKSENANRIATAAMTAILASQDGLLTFDGEGGFTRTSEFTPDMVTKTSRFMSDLLNYAGGRGNKAPWQMLPVLRTAGMFKGFMFNTINLLNAAGALGKTNAKRLGEPEMAAVLRPHITTGLILASLGGPMAAPYLGAVIALASMALGAASDRREKDIKLWIMENVPFWVRRGLPNLLGGVDLSAMLTMSIGSAPAGSTPAETLAAVLTGPPGSYISKVINSSAEAINEAMASPEDVKLKKTFKAIAGRGLGNIAEAVSGTYTDGDTIGPRAPEKGLRRTVERVKRGLSFNPTERAKYLEQRSTEMELSLKVSQLKKKLNSRIAGSDKGDGPDQDVIERSVDELVKFSEEWGAVGEKLGVRMPTIKDLSFRGVDQYRQATAERAGVER